MELWVIRRGKACLFAVRVSKPRRDDRFQTACLLILGNAHALDISRVDAYKYQHNDKWRYLRKVVVLPQVDIAVGDVESQKGANQERDEGPRGHVLHECV